MTDIEKLDIWNQPDEGDPLIWIHRVREQQYAKYPTPAARKELYSNPPSLDERRERVKKHIHEKLQQERTMNDSSIPKILTPETHLLETDDHV